MTDIKLRRSQLLFPFGPGAIYNHSGESFIAADITRWPGERESIKEERLISHLNIENIYGPPKDQSRAPFYRFPRWFFCPSCKKMTFVTREESSRPACRCGTKLTPMRFVVACEEGHIQDVDWKWFVCDGHLCESKEELYFKSKSGGGGGLDSLYIECKSCGATRDLGELRHIPFSCNGRHPWTYDINDDCSATTKVLQRGASNLRYDFYAEAISIPPYSDFDYWSDNVEKLRCDNGYRKLLDLTDDLVRDEDDLRVNACMNLLISDGYSENDIYNTFKIDKMGNEASISIDSGSLEKQEYDALLAEDRAHHPKDKFQKRLQNIKSFRDDHEAFDNAHLLMLFSNVCVVDRLRCVRVLRGYSRINKNVECMVPVDLGKNTNWLPGLEYYGEGFFISFDYELVNKWSKKKSVRERGEKILSRFESLEFSGYQDEKFCPSSAFVMLHTLAHVIMISVQYKSGYAASAVREKIYFSEEEKMCGILIYTSAGDVEGSMGGLAMQGEPNNLIPIINNALVSALECSQDPVCGESTGQGLDNLNLSACHACTLVSETSCQYNNTFLDRQLLINSHYGFFAEQIKNLMDR